MSDVESPSFFRRVRTWLRDSLVAGLVATVPLIVVFWVVDKVVLSPEAILKLIPDWTAPKGLGFLISFVLIIIAGALARTLARGVFGQAIARWFTSTLQAVPILGTLYSAVRQLLEAVFSARAQKFQRVVLVQFPRRGAYCLGFLTARSWPGVSEAVGEELLSVFVPTTPNPTSGFFVMFPEEEVTVLDMTVEEAFKSIMSSGIVAPARGGVLDVDLANITARFERLPEDAEGEGEPSESADAGEDQG